MIFVQSDTVVVSFGFVDIFLWIRANMQVYARILCHAFNLAEVHENFILLLVLTGPTFYPFSVFSSHTPVEQSCMIHYAKNTL